MKAKTFRLICFPVTGFLLALFLAITIACGIMAPQITTFLCPPNIDSKAAELAAAEGEKLAETIMGEGAVLVKNDNDVLPLDKDETPAVNLFGWGSSPHGWVVGGSGSGRVMSQKNDDHYAETPITTAFENYGIDVNTELTNKYTTYNNARPGISQGTLNVSTVADFYKLVEPAMSTYTDAQKANALTFSDTAFVVISRTAGEAKDPPRFQSKYNGTQDNSRHYLEISTEEEELLTYVGETYENVIVIINSTNVMELGFLDTIPGLDACLIVGGTGINAANAIPKIVYGDVNPSGRLADTYAYEFESNLNYYHAGDDGEGLYTNGGDLLLVGVSQNAGVANRHGNSYVDYVENIYVGYRWYETADAEGYWNGVSNQYGDGYDGVVQFPFGYGMNYSDTEFSWDVIEVTPALGSTLKEDDEITVRVNVTNNGTRAGQDVVQAYVTAPYSAGGIEKSHVSLMAFGKTLTPVEPGASQIVTLTFKAEDMASYDCYDANGNGFTGYELEGGSYQIKLMTDSHNVKTTATMLGNSSYGSFGNGIFTYNVPAAGFKYDSDSVTENPVDNKFTGDDALDGVSIDGDVEDVTFFSRANFPDTYEKAANRAISDEARALNRYTQAMATEWDNAATDILGNPVNNDVVPNKSAASGTLRLTENSGNDATEVGLELGGDYNHDEWANLLNQVSIADMKSYVNNNNLETGAINGIGLPSYRNLDGPNQISGFSSNSYRSVGYPNATVVAQTFNTQLALQFGSAIGTEAVTKGVRGWLGPAINMHRTPFGGRNYEYFSEDPLLTGMMASYEIIGGKNAGVYCYLKHIVLYEQETNREALYTWLTEQSLREIYLKPFKIAIQFGGVKGIMTSYNRIGAVWAGGSEALLRGVVRNEWGFDGAIITDWSDNQSYMNMDQALRATSTRYMGSYSGWLYSATSNRFEQQIYESFKQTMYMIMNSYYQNEHPVDATEKIETGNTTESFPWWIPVLIVIDVLVVAGCAVWIVFACLKKDKKPAIAGAPQAQNAPEQTSAEAKTDNDEEE